MVYASSPIVQILFGSTRTGLVFKDHLVHSHLLVGLRLPRRDFNILKHHAKMESVLVFEILIDAFRIAKLLNLRCEQRLSLQSRQM